MRNKIRHSGVVESVHGRSVRVRIIQSSACAACKAAGYCSAAESKEKVVEVYTPSATTYEVGQQVVVSMAGKMASKALWWGFGAPLLMLMIVLLAVMYITGREDWAAWSALLSLGVYYLLLWLFQDHISRQFHFTIE